MTIDAMGMKKAVKILLDKYEKEMNTEKQDVDMMSVVEHLADYEKVGTETVLGKECDKYKVNEGVTFSIYDNMYILKIENPGMKITAVNLDTDASLSDDLFETPEGKPDKKDSDYSLYIEINRPWIGQEFRNGLQTKGKNNPRHKI